MTCNFFAIIQTSTQVMLTEEELGRAKNPVFLGFRHLHIGSGFSSGPGLASIQYQMAGSRLVTLCNFYELCNAYLENVKSESAAKDRSPNVPRPVHQTLRSLNYPKPQILSAVPRPSLDPRSLINSRGTRQPGRCGGCG